MNISPVKIARTLSIVVCILLVAHLSTQALKVYAGYDAQLGFERQFNLDGENNIPSWYASTALLFCAGLLGLIGCVKHWEQAPRSRQWLGLAAIFLYLSLDEAASLHEMVNPLARALLDRTGVSVGYLHYSWVILGIVVVPIVGFSYLRFLRTLPIATSVQFVLAGLLYVGGAVGIEMFGGNVASQGGLATMSYAMLVAVEEGLEMFGIVIFMYALLSYIRQPDIAASLFRMHEALFSGSQESDSFLRSRIGKRSLWRSDRVA